LFSKYSNLLSILFLSQNFIRYLLASFKHTYLDPFTDTLPRCVQDFDKITKSMHTNTIKVEVSELARFPRNNRNGSGESREEIKECRDDGIVVDRAKGGREPKTMP